ncbi:MAG: hypothetical protein M3Y87_07515 [Myxococcota bacterium]|nr:hypothetical protein [Myxococcota bacterium]
MNLRRFLLLLPLATSVGLGACGSEPVLTDRDGGMTVEPDAYVPMVDGGRGDAGPPPVDAGPSCSEREPAPPSDPTAGDWAQRFANPGVGGDLPNVNAFAFGADGTVYVGGEFTTAGYAPAANIATWDGATGWAAMGEGLSGRVRSIAVGADGRVWVAYAPDMGWEATRIARWDGTAWTTIGDADGAIEEITLVGTTLLAGGYFGAVEGVTAGGLARWDGTGWSGWPGLAPDQGVLAISATSLDDICIGGDFETLGVIEARQAACWNGTAWQARSLPLQFYRGIMDLQRDPADGSLVGAGDFMLDETGTTGGSIARWVTDRWELIGGGAMAEFGPGSTKEVRGVAFAASGMFIGGAFRQVNDADPMEVNAAARWDGTTWNDLGGGLFKEVGFSLDTTNVFTVAAGPDGSVYFGGLFTRAGTTRVAHVVRWDGTYWSALRTPGERYEGVGGSVHALAREHACSVYVGGVFDYAGGVRANGIARYSLEGGYESLGDGVMGAVQDIATFGDGRIVIGGGFIDAASGTQFRNVAVWDGTSWSGLDGGPDGQVWAVAVDPSGSPDDPDLVYAGGSFVTAGDADAHGIAVWNGEAWAEVGGGLTGYPFEWDPTMNSEAYPYDVLVDPATGDVIVAGTFRSVGADELVVNNIARWDGESWHAYGEGLGDLFGAVHALAFWNGQLVASGSFDTSGETEVGHVATWNGTSWERLGPIALDGFAVSALEPIGDALYAGGMFAVTPGGEQAHVAVYDGTSWTDLGAGVSDIVEALIAMDEGVYFGGTFDRAGTSPSVGLALWQYAE